MFEFKLPDLGEGVAEGEILKWYVEVGQTIKEDESLVDIETDKAAVTIPSPKGGKLVSVAGGVGDTVAVGSVLCAIDESGVGSAASDAPTRPAAPTKAPAPSADGDGAGKSAPAPARAPARPAAPAVPAARTGAMTTAAVAPVTNRQGPVPAAPATRRLARELGIDINQVPGSGPAGRVTAEDVRLFAEGGLATAPVTTGTAAFAAAPSGIPYYELDPSPRFEDWGPVEREPLRSIRRKVARRMVTSMVTIPHVAHMDDADVTEFEAWRKRTRAETGSAPTLLAFVTKAVTVGLAQFRMFNASIDPERNELVYKRYYNIGFAADTPRGLIVPVVKNADQLSVIEISDVIRDLAGKGREGTIEVADMQGGTFTITNVGAIGGTYLVATINYPECAILGMGRVQEKPVIRDGQVVARKMVPLCITFDHRVADGADAARFMNLIIRYLSDPMSMLAEM